MIAAVAALLAGASDASAMPLPSLASVADPVIPVADGVPSPGELLTRASDGAPTWSGLELVQHTLLGTVDLELPAATVAVPSANDAFGQLPADGFAAYATGTVYHTDPALSPDEDNPAEIDLATSDAAYAAQALTAFNDELGRPIIPTLNAGNAFGRGRAVEVTPPEALGGEVDLSILDAAEAKAPPSRAPVTKETQTDASPLLKADSFKAEASARAVPTGCVIGDDLARGSGTANDTDLVDPDPESESTEPILSISTDEPPRAVSHSASGIRLTPIKDQPGRFGAVAEIRQTIAPITFRLPETDVEFTIEIGGEWVMRAAADGGRGGLSFGPEGGNDDRPVLRLVQGKDVVDEVGLREIGGRTGIYVDGEPVGDIRIGGDPRAIGGEPDSKPVESPTRVAAAADVVVVRLFELEAELRVGHMELALAVPPGGVQCPGIKVSKTSTPESVQPGEALSWTLAVSNPNDCVLDMVRVVDAASAEPEVRWKPVSTLPRSTRGKDGSLVFDNIGPIRTGDTKTVKINAEVDPDSGPGTITNKATATGVCGAAPMGGVAEAITIIGAAVAPPATPALPSESQGAGAPASGGNLTAARSSSESPAEDSTSATRRARAQESDLGTLARTGSAHAPFLVLATGLLATGRLSRRLKSRL